LLEILDSPDHVAALRISVILSSGEHDRAVAEIEARLGRHDKIGLLLDLAAFDDVTTEASRKDSRDSLTEFWELKRFPRAAIITHKAWVAALARMAGPMVPHVELRVFHPGESANALSWASDIIG
jgi:hypothetical protein